MLTQFEEHGNPSITPFTTALLQCKWKGMVEIQRRESIVKTILSLVLRPSKSLSVLADRYKLLSPLLA
jgi:hypothetical protein